MQRLNLFWNKVKNANGQAQIVSYSFWGVLLAGMLWGFCTDHLPNTLLLVWGSVSAVSLPVAIWCSKRTLRYTLMLDMLLSAIIATTYFMHDPHYVTTLVYNVDASGHFQKVESDISMWFTEAALLWMIIHSAYLANLIQRQELESERFK